MTIWGACRAPGSRRGRRAKFCAKPCCVTHSVTYKPRKSTVMAELCFARLGEMRAYVKRHYLTVTFLRLKVQWLVGCRSTSSSALVVQSRHPGRYPKLRSLTLSHPAFEPLTEHHAFSTGLLTATALTAAPALGVRSMLSVCHLRSDDKPMRALSFGRP